ncbi:CBS domain-containing protein [Streptomyces radicis]|uniref:CBS domain-containing protein n=1 Tax=Streptomyces radicis TaxID=1750517 RepID=A0A3A9WDZ1_9ACTN|nr:CBS domain-containing protein [Streptomyces radicis]RKN04227.1 CBS domain-containing protein [Streptomyces radicis]RKN14745.1 CBS domain-containing protein [Streptomyces radicis]
MKQRMVGSVMTNDVVRATPTTPFKRIAALLAEHRVSGLPIVDDDEKVVGVVSEADLLAPRAAGGRWRPGRRRAGRGAADAIGARTAGELMSAPAITVHARDPLVLAARAMAHHQVRRLPVLDDEDRLVGIVSRRDLLSVFLRTDAELRAEVLDHVLARALLLPPGAVEVAVADGVVTLKGRVERSGDVPIALRMTAQTDGVIAVVNRLTHRVDDSRADRGRSPTHR